MYYQGSLGNNNPVKHSGKTLIELVVVLGLMALVTGLGTYSLASQGTTSGANRISKDMVRTLQRAKHLSLSTHRITSFCLTRDGIECSRHANQWMSFQDANQNGKRDEATEPMLAYHRWSETRYRVKTSGTTTTAKFRANGFGNKNLSYWVCAAKPRQVYKVIINQAGRVRVASYKAGNKNFGRCAT